MQPLPGEILDQRVRLRVGQHPPGLLREHGRRLQRALRRHPQELVVGNAAPEEERQARRQFEVAEPVDAAHRDVRGIAFHPEDEFRTGQNAAQREIDAAVERARFLAAARVEVQQDLHVVIGQIAAVGATRERRENLPRTRRFLARDSRAGTKRAGGGSACRPRRSAGTDR